MTPGHSYPKLRWPLDLRLEQLENDQVLLISCPLGVSQPLALIAAVAPVVASMEGNLSFQQILDKFSHQGLSPELLQQLITLLDDNLFLATARFFEAQSLMHEKFNHSDKRPAALAGLSYSDKPAQLELEIDRYLAQDNTLLKIRQKKLSCLVSPHIDYRRGSSCYGKTYNRLREEDPDLYLVIGTSHQYSKNLFHLCSKDFESPLGLLHCERDFVSKLAAAYGEKRSFADEFLHKKEHSLELQMPFMRRLKNAPQIVPILVGSFHSILSSGKIPQQFEQYDRFAASLTDCIKQYSALGKRICFIAGVDMAHVGAYFGDSGNLTPLLMEQIAERDQQYLKHLSSQDKKSLFEHVAEDMDARRICGFPTMYTVLDVFDRLGVKYEAELFDYSQAVNYQNDCAVTFAGMGFYT